jgi:hypothetical protein
MFSSIGVVSLTPVVGVLSSVNDAHSSFERSWAGGLSEKERAALLQSVSFEERHQRLPGERNRPPALVPVLRDCPQPHSLALTNQWLACFSVSTVLLRRLGLSPPVSRIT